MTNTKLNQPNIFHNNLHKDSNNFTKQAKQDKSFPF